MICNFPLLFSHSKHIRMSTSVTISINYWLLINIIIIITKSHNNYCSIGVTELCLLNLLILIVFFCNSYPFVLFESLSHVINLVNPSHMFTRQILGKFTSFIFWNFKFSLVALGRFQNFKKVSSVNLSRISLLNIWLLVLIW